MTKTIITMLIACALAACTPHPAPAPVLKDDIVRVIEAKGQLAEDVCCYAGDYVSVRDAGADR